MPYDGLTKQTKSGPQWTGKIRLVESALIEPLSWRKPQRVFVNSMSDLFHEGVPDAFIDKVFAVMGLMPRHTFQILTKRADRMRAYLSVDDTDLVYRWGSAAGTFLDGQWVWGPGRRFRKQIEVFIGRCYGLDESDDPADGGEMFAAEPTPFPLPNVWLGVSAEDQPRADERIPPLLQTPAAVRFLSAEPLLGPLDLRAYLEGHEEHGIGWDIGKGAGACVGYTPALDWVIPGLESGGRARHGDIAWARTIVQDCQRAGVAVFLKQLGAFPIENESAWRTTGCRGLLNASKAEKTPHGFVPLKLQHKKGGDPSEWPEDLRVRQFPESRA